MEFPRFVFTAPGPFACNGGTYGHTLVQNEDDLKAALDAGFYATLPEAIEGKKVAPRPVAASPAGDAPDKMALIANAKALGIKVDERWSIANLQKAIDGANRAKED